MRSATVLAAALAACAASLFGQSTIANGPGTKPVVAIRNATIHPVTAPVIENGTIVFAGGVITEIGAGAPVPAGATVVDGAGLHVYPGMIDAGSSVGLTEIDSVAGTVDTSELGDYNPNARAAVALNPHSELIPVTRVNGVTHVLSVPEGGVISGQSALVRMAGWTPAEMVVKDPAALHVRFPRLRSAQSGEVPQEEVAEKEKEARKAYGLEIDRLRKVIEEARAYVRAAEARGPEGGAPRFDRDLMLEALGPAVVGKVPVVIHASLARDIRAALRFAEEMKLTNVVLAGAQDVAQFVPELRSRGISVILGPILALPAREDDPYDLLFTNAKVLHENGIRFAIQSQEAHNTRSLPYHAAACAAFGLPKEEALKAITIYPAQILGVADRLGSLEVGKAANVILTDGDPLEIRTTVRRVFIDGMEMPMESRHTMLYEKFLKRP